MEVAKQLSSEGAKDNPIAALYRSVDGTFKWDKGRSALLVVDMQKGSVRPDLGYGRFYSELGLTELVERRHARTGSLIPNIQDLLKLFRQEARPVCFFRVSYSKAFDDLPRHLHPRLQFCRNQGVTIPFATTGSVEEEIIEELSPRPGELVYSKRTASAFASTSAAEDIRSLGVDTLVVTGVATNYCVESTVRDATDRGFSVVVVADACDAVSNKNHELGLASMAPFARILNMSDIAALWEGAA